MQVPKNLKLARSLAGLRQIDLAQRAGVSRSLISLIELGRRKLQPYLAKRLEKILNIDLEKND